MPGEVKSVGGVGWGEKKTKQKRKTKISEGGGPLDFYWQFNLYKPIHFFHLTKNKCKINLNKIFHIDQRILIHFFK